jgi:hypothetical protein
MYVDQTANRQALLATREATAKKKRAQRSLSDGMPLERWPIVWVLLSWRAGQIVPGAFTWVLMCAADDMGSPRPGRPRKSKKDTTKRCSACKQYGHVRNNRVCDANVAPSPATRAVRWCR